VPAAEDAHGDDLGLGRDTADDVRRQAERVATAAQREIAAFQIPPWLRTVGISAWLVLGMVIVVAIVLAIFGLLAAITIPLAIAAVLAAILVPLTDRMEKWRIPRWLGATLVLVLALSIVIATAALVINGITGQADEIWRRLSEDLARLTNDAGGSNATVSTVQHQARNVVHLLTFGVLTSFVGTASGLILSSVLALFILLFLLKDWRQITGWVVQRAPLPARVGTRVLDGTVNAFRGYARGLTVIGVANAVVVTIGALILRVPLVGTIGIITFVFSYVPYLGAFVAGAFGVLIAYGSGGSGVALAMLAIVLLANNTIQNLLEPFAFGARLRLHPLAVLITVTAATMLFGILGAILAAPLTSAAVNAYHEIRSAEPPESARNRTLETES
jgi:predicted PurR-regulated permease PerM